MLINQTRSRVVLALFAATVVVALPHPLLAAGRTERPNEITLYAGRGESLVEPLIQRFEEETGVRVNVRYAGTAELAVLLQEEGARSPADIFWAQDAGALGAVARRGLLRSLPHDLYADTPEIYRNAGGEWVATSGRARVVAHATDAATIASLPRSAFDLTEPRYAGLVGWAPTNASFQSFITAMRVMHGDDRTEAWVTAMIANGTKSYRNNTAIVEAIAAGEITFGITNNYYLLRFLAENPDYPVRQSFFATGDVGNLVNVAGAGILRSAPNPVGAERFLRFLLEQESQRYFTDVVHEYPVTESIAPNPNLESFEQLLSVSPRLDLDAMEDLEGTLQLLRRAGAL